jgi:hypothetical protein
MKTSEFIKVAVGNRALRRVLDLAIKSPETAESLSRSAVNAATRDGKINILRSGKRIEKLTPDVRETTIRGLDFDAEDLPIGYSFFEGMRKVSPRAYNNYPLHFFLEKYKRLGGHFESVKGHKSRDYLKDVAFDEEKETVQRAVAKARQGATLPGVEVEKKHIQVDPNKLPYAPSLWTYRATGTPYELGDNVFVSAFGAVPAGYMSKRGGYKYLRRFRKHRFEAFPTIDEEGKQIIDFDNPSRLPFYSHHAAVVNPEARLYKMRKTIPEQISNESQRKIDKLLSFFKKKEVKHPLAEDKMLILPKTHLGFDKSYVHQGRNRIWENQLGYETILTPTSSPRVAWKMDPETKNLYPVIVKGGKRAVESSPADIRSLLQEDMLDLKEKKIKFLLSQLDESLTPGEKYKLTTKERFESIFGKIEDKIGTRD